MTAFRALRHRDFRRFWLGQLVSLTGTWMQGLALGWLVWRMTDSPFWLGVVSAMPLMPSLFLASIGGVIVDRHVKRRLLLLTQGGMVVQSAALGFLTINGTIQLYQIILLAGVAGILVAIDMPARLSFIHDMVGKDDLDNALALNSTAINASRIVGSSVAGILVPIVGEGGCFLINSASFFGVIATLMGMSDPEQPRLSNRDPFHVQIRQAWVFVRTHPTIYPLIIGLAFFGIFGFTPTILLPIFADHVLNVGVRGLGALMGAAGVGALVGSLVQASLPRESARGRIVYHGAMGMALAFLGFAFSRWFPLSLVFMALVGFAMILMLTSLVTLMLDLTPEDLHGRIMGLYTTSFIGLAPIGTLLAGVLALGIGAPATMALYSAIGLVAAFFIFGRASRTLSSHPPISS